MNDMEFSLKEHYAERIAFHEKMLLYYLTEQQNEKLAT